MLSLIMLSWDRIANVRKLLERYRNFGRVSEIIVFNNNPRHDLRDTIKAIDREIILIQSNTDLGMYTRFAAAGLAVNDCILFLDDDIFVPESTVDDLYEKWMEHPRSCHGTHGRSVNRGYRPRDHYGRVKVVLTRCLMTSREVCLHAFQHSSSFLDLESIPNGNGEDIILSYSAILLSGDLNWAYHLAFDNLEGWKMPENTSGLAIHQRWPQHYVHRQAVVERCEALLVEQRETLKKRRSYPLWSRFTLSS
jgi:hypothetical protein